MKTITLLRAENRRLEAANKRLAKERTQLVLIASDLVISGESFIYSQHNRTVALKRHGHAGHFETLYKKSLLRFAATLKRLAKAVAPKP